MRLNSMALGVNLPGDMSTRIRVNASATPKDLATWEKIVNHLWSMLRSVGASSSMSLLQV
jgi:hypothetical protein